MQWDEHMQIKVSGIVLKEMNIGEADRIITLLTKEFGVIRAFAKGSRRMGSKLFYATQLLTSGNYLLYKGKDKYIVTEAERVSGRSFFELRNDIERLSLAQYISELVILLAPHEEDASEFLRLVLNSFAALQNGSRSILLIKAAVELRLLAMSGFCPDINGCSVCGNTEENTTFSFFPSEGCLVCGECIGDTVGGIAVSGGIIAAMRHIIFAPQEKIFSFRISEESLRVLRFIGERYMLSCTERSFKTLEFFNTLVS